MSDQSPAPPASTSTAAAFRAMHTSGCFVLPNPWDAGSAKLLEHLGFRALATSAGFAFSKGMPDDVSAVPRDPMLDHIREVVRATSLPVNADFQTGDATDPKASPPTSRSASPAASPACRSTTPRAIRARRSRPSTTTTPTPTPTPTK
jgi:2-methylisocitrate lyase-like PEP mutase family enzyme